jgi:7,8-dihydropterin-6-yl-methyl-4-(beta-D-ribofuranosyl)aminobenzene 5'-phosphate synthase
VFQLRFYEDKNGKRRKHGVPEDEGIFEIEQAGGEVLFNNKPTEILPGVWTTGEIPRVTQFEHLAPPSNGGRRVIVVDEEEIDDQILDDQALWMNVKEVGPIIITGCAHSGTVNTLLYVQKCVHEIKPLRNIYGFVGGTHLIGCSQEYLMQTIGGLKEFNLGFISPCHCTGFKAAAELWKAFSKAFVLNFSGRVIRTGKKLKKPIF